MKKSFALRWAAAISALAALMACRRPATVGTQVQATPPVATPAAPLAGSPTATTAPAAPALQVPRASTAVAIEQHDDDQQWLRSVATEPFLQPDSSEAARPYSIARMLWDDEALYLSLYAADQNIAADATPTDSPLWLGDAFDVRIQGDSPTAPVYAIDVAPNGALSDARIASGGSPDRSWHSGARLSIDIDGSLNLAQGEDDEEWVAFVAIPWKSLELTPHAGLRLRTRIGRCDTLRDGQRRCGQWGGAIDKLVGTVELAK